MFEINENIYGHKNRLHWIIEKLDVESTILEFGCGTGYMISHQLLKQGFNVYGVDLDQESIEYGRNIFRTDQFDPDRLKDIDINELENTFDVIIASEVLEHVHEDELNNILKLINNRLKKEAVLLVTVPNGYGWFELENFLWTKLKLEKFFDITRLSRVIYKIKKYLIGEYIDAEHPSTLSASPHVQKFTYSSIQKILMEQSFEVEEIKGTVLFAGPMSNIFFTGFKPVMRFNLYLGSILPWIASGFLISCRPRR